MRGPSTRINGILQKENMHQKMKMQMDDITKGQNEDNKKSWQTKNHMHTVLAIKWHMYLIPAKNISKFHQKGKIL